MRIYLASRYGRRAEMAEVAAELRKLGHVITSRWVDGTHQSNPTSSVDGGSYRDGARFAQEDYEDVLASQCVVSFTEAPDGVAPGRSRGGRHVEFGLGLASRKYMVIVGPYENVFHHLDGVVRFENKAELYQAVKTWKV